MLKMGLARIYQRPNTSKPHPQHRTWPYLLRRLTIDRPNHVRILGWLYSPPILFCSFCFLVRFSARGVLQLRKK